MTEQESRSSSGFIKVYKSLKLFSWVQWMSVQYLHLNKDLNKVEVKKMLNVNKEACLHILQEACWRQCTRRTSGKGLSSRRCRLDYASAGGGASLHFKLSNVQRQCDKLHCNVQFVVVFLMNTYVICDNLYNLGLILEVYC